MVKEYLEQVKKLAYKNQEQTGLGFEFKGAWIANPFVDVTGRFEFKNLEASCEYYGQEKVLALLNRLLVRSLVKAENRMFDVKSFLEKEILQAELDINGYKMDRECLMDYDVEIETLQTYKQKLETILRMLSEV